MTRYDTIVIGAGANGLATAALLAKKSQRVLVLERRDVAGGTNATEEFHPGFRVSACRDDTGWVPDSLVRRLDLGNFGLDWLRVPAGLVAVSADQRAIATYPDIGRTVDELKSHSRDDAARWTDFCGFVARVGAFLEAAYSVRAPKVQSRALGDLLALAGLGQRLRRLGKREMMEVLRAVPMPIADIGEEWFTLEALRAMLAVAGTDGVRHGPMSGGTALVFLHGQVGLPAGSIGVRRVPRGGTGALASALAGAARESGVEIRLGAEVSEVVVERARAIGVRLSTGETIAATQVVSSADPKRSFSWIDPSWLDPELLRAVDNIRMRGTTARVHYALDALPRFQSGGAEIPRDALGGTLVLASSVSAVERAYDSSKYGEVPVTPALSITVPTLSDPSLAPERRHVLSVTAHHVPFVRTEGWSNGASDALGEHVTSLLSAIVPDLRERTLQRWVLTPRDIETRYGCTEGSLQHGELALDQFLFMRPMPSCSRYAAPLAGFWLCGTGTHPGSSSGAGAALVTREITTARR
jgi:phytoene dehydrogenase-like protein